MTTAHRRVTKNDIITEMRRLGYTGPVSYCHSKLLEILDEVKENVPPVGTAPEGNGTVESWYGLTARTKGAKGLRIAGERGTRYEFMSYTEDKRDDGDHSFVTLIGGVRGDRRMRYVRPNRVLLPNGKAVMK